MLILGVRGADHVAVVAVGTVALVGGGVVAPAALAQHFRISSRSLLSPTSRVDVDSVKPYPKEGTETIKAQVLKNAILRGQKGRIYFAVYFHVILRNI